MFLTRVLNAVRRRLSVRPTLFVLITCASLILAANATIFYAKASKHSSHSVDQVASTTQTKPQKKQVPQSTDHTQAGEDTVSHPVSTGSNAVPSGSASKPTNNVPVGTNVPPAQPFNLAYANLYQAYACQTDPNTSYLNIGDVIVGFTSSSGGQLSYWLEGDNIENIGSYADHHTVTVPSGTWQTTLNKLTGSYEGPHQLYVTIVDTPPDSLGSVRVAILVAGVIRYTPWITLPAANNC